MPPVGGEREALVKWQSGRIGQWSGHQLEQGAAAGTGAAAPAGLGWIE